MGHCNQELLMIFKTTGMIPARAECCSHDTNWQPRINLLCSVNKNKMKKGKLICVFAGLYIL